MSGAGGMKPAAAAYNLLENVSMGPRYENDGYVRVDDVLVISELRWLQKELGASPRGLLRGLYL